MGDSPSLLLWRKAFLQSLNGGNISFEGLGQDIIINGGIKQSIGDRNHACIGITESRESHRCLIINSIVLEVNKSLWEYEHISCFKWGVKSLLVVSTNPTCKEEADKEK